MYCIIIDCNCSPLNFLLNGIAGRCHHVIIVVERYFSKIAVLVTSGAVVVFYWAMMVPIDAEFDGGSVGCSIVYYW